MNPADMPPKDTLRRKSTGVRAWLRKGFGQSTANLAPSPGDRTPTSNKSSLRKTSNGSHDSGAELTKQNGTPVKQEPTVTLSTPTPPAISAEPTSPQPIPSPPATSNPAPVATQPVEQAPTPPTEPPKAAQSLSPPPIINIEAADPEPGHSPDGTTVPNTADTVKNPNLAWDRLRASLQNLRATSEAFGPLASAVGVLLDCFEAIKTSAKNCHRQNHEDLATELATLSDSLSEYFKTTEPQGVSKSVSDVGSGIERQAAEIKKIAENVSEPDEEGLANLGLSTWSIANEQLVNTRLEKLNLEKQATYASELSTAVNRRTCTEGTRTKDLTNIVEWASNRDAPSMYWVRGEIGAGKTTVAFAFSEWLERHEQLGASFFCTRASVNCRDVTRVIPTIVHQLARYSASFQSALNDVLGAGSDAGSKDISEQFERLLRQPLQKMNEPVLDGLVVVIDGLDECDDQTGAQTILDVILQHAQDIPLKFFITSPSKVDIKTSPAVHLHDLDKSLTDADIEQHLKSELGFIMPSASEYKQLVERSGGSFIYAATLARYIPPIKKQADRRKRLRAILEATASTPKGHAGIDALYTALLDLVLGKRETGAKDDDKLSESEAQDVRAVLRTVVLAQEPIGVDAIAKLSDIDNSERVEYALLPLRSVLYQSETTGLVSVLHASFSEFMLSNERSGAYFCDPIEHNQLLARRCLKIMEEQLRFNICEFETSFVLDDQVADLQTRIENKISPSLTYACRHWANHLALAPRSDDLVAMLDGFLSNRLLFWMEVLNVRRELAMGVEGLVKAKQWLTKSGSVSTELVLLADGARNFVADFNASQASRSTPHIYISSLPFCPRSNFVYYHYGKRTKGLLELKGSLMAARKPLSLATWKIGSAVHSVAFSPDGNRVVVGCDDGTVNIRDAHDGASLYGPLQGPAKQAFYVASSPDGRVAASVSLDGKIQVWNVSDGTVIAGPFGEGKRSVLSVSFSPDGSRVVSVSADTTVHIWDATNGKLLLGPSKDHIHATFCVAFSPKGDLIATTSRDHSIRLWNSHDGTSASSPFKGHTDTVSSLAFTPDGAHLVSGSWDNSIRVWNVSDGKLVAGPFAGHEVAVYSVAVSPDGRQVASGSADRTVRVWNIDDGTLAAGPFLGHTNAVWSVTFSPDGTQVLSGSNDGTVRMWGLRQGLPPPALPERSTSVIQSVSFSPDGKRVWSSTKDHQVKVWDISNGSSTTGPHQMQFFSQPLSDFSPDMSYVACSSKEGEVQIASTADWSLVAGPFGVKSESLSASRFSPDNTRIIMGLEEGVIQTHPIRNRQGGGRTLTGHNGKVASVALSPDGALAASSSDDKTLRVWDVVAPILEFDSYPDPHPTVSGQSNAVSEGWKLTQDGWVVNSSGHLLFWVPDDISLAWPSPHAKLIVTDSGAIQVPKQKLLIGQQWSKCYSSK